jgi:hypothetical protein
MPSFRSPSGVPTLLRALAPRRAWQCNTNIFHRRLASTTTATKGPTITLRTYIYATFFLSLGLGAGYVGTAIVRPPPFPKVGSDADAKQLLKLAADVDKLPIVRDLRGIATKQGKKKSEDAMRQGDATLAKAGGELAYGDRDEEAWIELPVSYEKSNTLVNDSMSGTRGLGVQRAFWSPVKKELVMVIWFGGGLSGWPGITHGGAIATMFTEAMKRAVQCTNISDGTSGRLIIVSKSATLQY